MTEVDIPNTGYSLKADWYDTDSEHVLLVLPGYTSTKEKYADMVQYLVDGSDYSALVLDYGGHGVSPFVLDDLTRADNFSDAIAAFDWLVKNHPNKKITVMGTSYGGFHAAYLTKFRQFENVIFRVPASYPEETFYTRIGDMEDPHGGRYRFNPENYVDHWLFSHASSVKGTALLITHELDVICPPVSTMPFKDAFKAEHWEAKGFKHGLWESDVTEEQVNDYYEKIVDWLKK